MEDQYEDEGVYLADDELYDSDDDDYEAVSYTHLTLPTILRV